MLAIECESEDAPQGFNQSGGLGWTLIGLERQPDDGPLPLRCESAYDLTPPYCLT
jgi:hypothetical protein